MATIDRGIAHEAKMARPELAQVNGSPDAASGHRIPRPTKCDDAAKAGASLMTGASGDEIARQYRKRVSANAKRLGKARTRRRRK
jgi:hypothetical protein